MQKISQRELSSVNFDEEENHLRVIIKQQKCYQHIMIAVIIILVAILGWAGYDKFYGQRETQFPSKIQQSQIQIPQTVTNINDHLPIYSGEIHFNRMPKEYWEHRLLMIKALGLNSISVYIFWNDHEVRKGLFDFNTGTKDLVGFLKLAKKHNLKVLLRPGPYVCAQWDFGGLPARLLGIKDLVIRTSNFLYESQVKIYFTALAEVIRPFLFENGGNIIMVQIQNELGSLNSDFQHTLNLIEMWKSLNIVSNFYYEDAQKNWWKHYWNGSIIGFSQGKDLKQYQRLEKFRFFQNRLIFGGEVYSGWLTLWGGKWGIRDKTTIVDNFKNLLENGKSFSIYVVFGGTNFGLTAGGIQLIGKRYSPHITSYDYDAPINQQGSATQKYHMLRKIFLQHYRKSNSSFQLPQIPNPLPKIQIPPFSLSIQADMLSNLPEAIEIPELSYFQSDLIQFYHQGIIVYETELLQKKIYKIGMMIHDYAIIYVDGEMQKQVFRGLTANQSVDITCVQEKCQLRIVVQAMGHVNYGENQAKDVKGLIHFFDKEDSTVIFKWKIRKIPLNTSQIFKWNKLKGNSRPVLLSGEFTIKSKGDTYFDMSTFGKGYIWINSNLLGRYWEVGPQKRLFCPSVWLKSGKNQIKILEMTNNTQLQIQSFSNLE